MEVAASTILNEKGLVSPQIASINAFKACSVAKLKIL